jgi:hypothetical protein
MHDGKSDAKKSLSAVTVHFALNVHWDWRHPALGAAALVALLLKVDILWVILAGTAIPVLAFQHEGKEGTFF